MSAVETDTPVLSEEVVQALPALSEALYEHWRHSSNNYELKRQPAYKDTTATLQRVFADQANAIAPLIDSLIKNASASEDLFDSATWVKVLDVTVMDADGWDRSNFEASWAEKITRAEFDRRLASSTHSHNDALRKAGWDV